MAGMVAVRATERAIGVAAMLAAAAAAALRAGVTPKILRDDGLVGKRIGVARAVAKSGVGRLEAAGPDQGERTKTGRDRGDGPEIARASVNPGKGNARAGVGGAARGRPNEIGSARSEAGRLVPLAMVALVVIVVVAAAHPSRRRRALGRRPRRCDTRPMLTRLRGARRTRPPGKRSLPAGPPQRWALATFRGCLPTPLKA